VKLFIEAAEDQVVGNEGLPFKVEIQPPDSLPPSKL
jgi:hypothetical protein